MKRIITFILTLAVLFTVLSACEPPQPAIDSSNEASSNTDSVSEAPVQTPDSNIPSADTANTGYMTSKEAFMEIVGNLVDLSLYDELEESESNSHKSYSYYIKYENERDYDLDYSITVSDGTSFTLPIPFSELEKHGWTVSSSNAKTLMEPGFMSWAYCSNAAGQEIYVSAYNPTEETIPFKECSVCKVEFTMFDTSSGAAEPYENAPGFTICGSITNAYTLEEIVSLLGAPESFYYSISLDENGAYETSDIVLDYQQASSAYSYLSFKLSGDGNYIIEMEYEHIPE